MCEERGGGGLRGGEGEVCEGRVRCVRGREGRGGEERGGGGLRGGEGEVCKGRGGRGVRGGQGMMKCLWGEEGR